MGTAARHMRSVDPIQMFEEDERPVSAARRAVLLATVAAGALVLSLGLCFVIGHVGGAYSTGGWFNRFWFVFFAVCGFVVGSCVVCRDWFANKPENLYLIVVLAVTMLFSWSLSVREMGWDVGVHYRNILTFADWEGDVDYSVSDSSLANVAPLEVEGGGPLQTVDELEESLDENSANPSESKRRTSNLMWYVTSIEYLPYALVMRLCRLLGLSFSRTLLLVRLTGGIFYAVVTFMGMRKLREGKMLYAAIALLPTSVFLAAELGYSYWLFSLCLYGFATLAGMMQGSVEVRVSSIVKMLAALFVGMLPRVVYFPLMFLCLLIPTERFSSVRAARVYRGLLVGSALAAFGVWLVPKLLTGFGSGDARGGEVSPAGQIQYILTHPVEYAKTFLKFVLPPLSMEGGKADVEGVNMLSGFLSVEASPGLLVNYGYLPRAHWAFTACMWALLLWTTLTDKYPDGHTGWLPGVLSLVLTFGVFVMIVTALYFEFTPVGLPEIHGVQRRYLLPLMFPLLVFVGPHSLGMRGRVRDDAYNAIVLVGLAAILLTSWWTVCVGLIV